MGYYASGSGAITFIAPTDQEIEQIDDVLSKVFEVERAGSSKYEFYVYDSEKYHGDDVRDVLEEVTKICPISDGEIEYAGEDYCHWRFIYHQTLGWIEQDGHIEYDPLPEVS